MIKLPKKKNNMKITLSFSFQPETLTAYSESSFNPAINRGFRLLSLFPIVISSDCHVDGELYQMQKENYLLL